MIVGLGVDFWICLFFSVDVLFHGSSFLSVFFGEIDGCVLPIFLGCSPGEFKGSVCWYWRLKYWVEFG